MSTLAIYDALKPNQKFYTIDIIKDLRILPVEFFNDDRIKVLYGDCISDEILKEFEDNSIDFLFSDTIHYYGQVNNEFVAYKNKLKKGSIMFVDDIKLNDKGMFYDEWVGEKCVLTCQNIWKGSSPVMDKNCKTMWSCKDTGYTTNPTRNQPQYIKTACKD